MVKFVWQWHAGADRPTIKFSVTKWAINIYSDGYGCGRFPRENDRNCAAPKRESESVCIAISTPLPLASASPSFLNGNRFMLLPEAFPCLQVPTWARNTLLAAAELIIQRLHTECRSAGMLFRGSNNSLPGMLIKIKQSREIR